ncbi:MAG: XdhC family protein [Acidobacteriota bacterium]
MDLYQEIVRLRRSGRKAAVATIIRRLGSTPRKDNAKMLIYDDGSSLGSVGGGCTEAEVWQRARQVMDSGQSALLRYELTQEDAEQEGLVCGGTVEIFLEPILPDPKLIIMGAGHVGQALAGAAHPLGFQVAVVDDRETFACRERFPHAHEIVAAPFEEGLEQVQVTENSFVLVVTRGHSHDQTALEKAIQTPARYVGLVGSRRKIQMIVQDLLDKGFPPETFSRLYAPIGIEIGSETPEEIAVSVMAELIALRKGVHQRSAKQEFVMKLLERHESSQLSVPKHA